MKAINVLSLFDGMSCGRVALERAGIPVGNYYASEIDKFAIQVSKKNYPGIIQLGNVEDWFLWDIDWNSIDIIFAGFPCQAWSLAGKQKGDSDPRGALVHDLIDIWNEAKKHNPDVKFLFENVKMKKEYLDYISKDLFGVEPVRINSALVSAQNRDRYYWTSAGSIPQPEDKGIILENVLDAPGAVGRVVGRRIKDGKRADNDKSVPAVQRFEARKDNKSGTLTTVQKDNVVLLSGEVSESPGTLPTTSSSMLVHNLYGGFGERYARVFTDKSPTLRAAIGGGAMPSVYNGTYEVAKTSPLAELRTQVRNLTPIECERLQTLPEGYTDGVSNTQRYKMIGNGWTVDVIVHILKHIFKGQ